MAPPNTLRLAGYQRDWGNFIFFSSNSITNCPPQNFKLPSSPSSFCRSATNVPVMAATFNIQKPYVLATLPRPLNHSGGSYAVGDVWGQQPGSKKRRRPELVVGIDGEAANIYDVRICWNYAPIDFKANCLTGPLVKVGHILPHFSPIDLYLPSLLVEVEIVQEQGHRTLHLYFHPEPDCEHYTIQGCSRSLGT